MLCGADLTLKLFQAGVRTRVCINPRKIELMDPDPYTECRSGSKGFNRRSIQNAVLRIRIRDPVLFDLWIRDPE